MNLLCGVALSFTAGYAYNYLNQGRLKEVENRVIYRGKSYDRISSVFISVLSDFNIDRKDVRLVVVNERGAPRVFGSLLSRDCGVIVPLDIDVCDMNEKSLKVVLKHELVHSVKNHLLKIPCYSFVAGVTPLGIGFLCSVDSKISVLVSLITTISTVILYVQATECEADAIAIESSKKDEVEAYIKLFNELKTHMIKQKKYFKSINSLNYFSIRENGDYLLGILHPFYSTRIKACEKALLNKS